MAERYTKLLSLPDNQYTPGAPVLIAAGALLRDNETGKILAQVKFKNISPNEIVAVKVSITASDVAGHPVRGVSEYQYLDLKARRDAAFGQKQAIPLPDNTTRNIAVSCTSVIFTDGTAWESIPGAKWKPLPKQQRLEELLQDSKLADQYRRDTTEQSLYVPLRYGDIWLCTCGGVNRGGEAKCHRCNLEKQRMAAALNPATLHKHSDAYHKAVAAKEKKQRRKTILFCGIAAGIIAVVLLVTQVVLPTVKNNSAYRSAVALMESGKYEEAIAAFEAMDGYKDAQAKIQECANLQQQAKLAAVYQEAAALMAEGRYEEAITIFESLGNYEDAAQKVTECEEGIQENTYQSAIALFENGDRLSAYKLFFSLGDYRDSQQYLEKSTPRIKYIEGKISKTKTEYTYDSNGLLISTYKKWNDSLLEEKTEFEYDSENRLQSAIINAIITYLPSENTVVTTMTGVSVYRENEITTEYSYQKLHSTGGGQRDYTEVLTLNNRGDVEHSLITYEDGATTERFYEITYDPSGKIVSKIEYCNGSIYSQYEYIYDPSGNMVSKIEYRNGSIYSQYKYIYDEYGLLAEVVDEEGHGGHNYYYYE